MLASQMLEGPMLASQLLALKLLLLAMPCQAMFYHTISLYQWGSPHPVGGALTFHQLIAMRWSYMFIPAHLPQSRSDKFDTWGEGFDQDLGFPLDYVVLYYIICFIF